MLHLGQLRVIDGSSDDECALEDGLACKRVCFLLGIVKDDLQKSVTTLERRVIQDTVTTPLTRSQSEGVSLKGSYILILIM